MILRIVDTPGHLELVSEWRPDDRGGPGVFPHDLEARPSADGSRMLLYVAYWDAGAYIVDVTDAAAPAALARIEPLDASDHLHTFKTHPTPIDGRVLAVVAPETFVGEASGTFRLFNVTDPARPEPFADWRLPPGDLVNPENLLFSPHEFTLADGKLYASAFHGGVWVLDLATFRPVAAWQHSFGDPARTDDWAVDVETAVYHDGLVYAVDMGAGVVALRGTEA